MFSICYNPCNKIQIFLQQILSMEYLFSQNILPNIHIFKSFLGINISWALTKIFTTFCKQKWRPSPGLDPSELAGRTGAHFHKPSSRTLFSQNHPGLSSTCPELQSWQWTASNHLKIYIIAEKYRTWKAVWTKENRVGTRLYFRHWIAAAYWNWSELNTGAFINKLIVNDQLDLRCYIVKLRIQGCRYWV